MANLGDYRKEIDRLDRKIVELLNKRVDVAGKIWKIKSKTSAPVLDQKREKAIIAKLKKLNKNLPASALEAIYGEIISATRATEKPITVAYLGPEGTFAHEAALKKFGSSSVYRPKKGFQEVFKDVEKGLADYGVLPIENSIEGSVNRSLDLLTESTLSIFGEKILPAHQNLLSSGKNIGAIKTVYSHPQALSQCRRFIGKYLPKVKVVPTASTAAAAKLVAGRKGAAAIASSSAAKLYKLNILKSRIEDFSNNFTRFIVLSYQQEKRSGNDKTSIAITIKNRHGELLKVLGLFEDKNINLSKIVSRPIPHHTWEHTFYIDFEGHLEDKKVAAVLKKIARRTSRLKVLGSYPAC